MILVNDSYELFKRVITECNCSNTYKMAWAKGIVECLVEQKYNIYNDNWILISVKNIVEKMVKYYWDFEMFYGYYQGPKTVGKPVIVQNVISFIEKYNSITNNSEQLRFNNIKQEILSNPVLSSEYESTIKSSVKAAKENVSWRFARLHNVIFNDYQCSLNDDEIKIKSRLAKAIIENKDEIISLIDKRWNELLSAYNEVKEGCNQIDSDTLKTFINETKEQVNDEFGILEEPIEEESNNNLNIPLQNIKMSNRLRNSLLREGIMTLDDFIKLDYSRLERIRNLGEKSLSEASYILLNIKDNLSDYIIEEEEIPVEDSIELSDDIIDKLYSKIKIEDCDFSIRLQNVLQQYEILTLADFIRCPNDKFKNMKNLGKKSLEEALNYKKKIMLENVFDDDNSDFIFRIINSLAGYKEITIIMLKNYLMANTNYPVEKLTEDISILREDNKIEYTMNGIKVKKKKLKEVLDEFDLSTKMLLIERFNGKTLQELGETRSLTRERIRQKLQKAINNLPSVEEDKYKDRFEYYDFSEEEFTSIFNEEKYIYYYLKEKYKAGSNDIIVALKDDRFNENQKSKIRELRKIVKLFGETIVLNKINVVNALIKEYAKKEIGIEKFTEIYNDFCDMNPEYDLTHVDDRSMEGLISRSGIAVFDLGRKFRYYNFSDIIGDDELESLKDIYYGTDTGYYSTLVIYKNNIVMMSSLDIRNEYELHNISKQYFNNRNGIVFDRMPNFSINGIQKDDFFKEKIKELAPISVNDFAETMETEYGHKAATISGYILSNFQDYIDNGVLKNDITILPDYEIERIKLVLKEPIYSIDEVKSLLLDNGFENIDDILTSGNMYKAGYRIRSSYVMKKEITSIEDYLKKLASEQDFIANDNFLRNSTYYTMKKRVEKSFDIFLISNDEYITIKKMNSLGVTKEDVMNFCNQVRDRFINEEYFTLNNVRDLIEIDKLDDFGFDDIFLENIISNIDDLFCTKFSNNKIFSFLYPTFDSKKFVVDTIAGRESIFVDDLQEEFLDKYGITVTQERIKNAIIDTELYFSDELNKIYQNKEYYYEEVFNYE